MYLYLNQALKSFNPKPDSNKLSGLVFLLGRGGSNGCNESNESNERYGSNGSNGSNENNGE